MGARHRFLMFTHDGVPLAEIPGWESIQYSRILNNVGWFQGIVRADFDQRLLDVDRLIEFWRQPDGGEDRLEMVGFLRYWEHSEDSSGREALKIGGPDQIDLLDRRVVGYNAGTAGAEKTDHADDMIKAVVSENMGALAPLDEAGRPRAYDPAHFFVTPDSHDGPTVIRRFSWRETWAVIREIADAAADQGVPVYFDLIPTGPGRFEFRTYVYVRGMYRTASAGLAPVIFAKDRGNLASPVLREDWTEEWNYIFGGGPGEGTSRMIDPEKDTLRGYRSIWNRRERFQDAREESTMLGIAWKAFERLQASRPRLVFGGDLLDAPQSRYGVDWGFGDIVTAQFKGYSFDGTVRAVSVSIDREGAEQVKARMDVAYATR